MNVGALTVATLQNTNQDGLPTLPGGWGSGNIAAVTSKITNGYVGPTRGLFVGSGVPYLQSLHIKANGIKFEPEYFVTEDWSRQHKKSVLAQGDVLVVQTGDIGQVALVPPLWTGANCHALIILAPNENVILGSYLSWVLNSSYGKDCLLSRQTGALHPHLNCSAVREIQVPIPPLTAQNAIASFLDRKTAAIDALIEKKQKLVDLLAEKRAALINQAVTKGLDPNVPMKDSGIPWVGEIPSHWTMRRLKNISPSQQVGLVINPSNYVDPDGSIPFIYGSNVSEGRIDVTTARRTSENFRSALRKSELRSGDLVCVRVGDPGITAVVPPELEGANCASVMIVRGHESFDSRWLCVSMNSTAGRENVRLVAYGAAQKQFNIEHAVNFVYATPPLEEQKALTNYLSRETGVLEEAMSLAAQQIARLQEYRQALITAAVTGQLEIPEGSQ